MKLSSRMCILLTSLMMLGFSGTEAGSQDGQKRVEEAGGIVPLTGNRRERQQWQEIVDMIRLEDEEGRPVHPTLKRLWEWLEGSGHTIYIDMRKRRGAINVAGSFALRKFDPKGGRHVGVIRLNLSNIDQAIVADRNRLRNGLIPFEGLGRVERYAEVLGHEMSHAVHILSDHALGRSVIDLVDRTNEMLLDRNRKRGLESIGTDFRARLSERDELLRRLESRAGDIEKIVWSELHQAHARRER